jgi:hypothetical protein
MPLFSKKKEPALREGLTLEQLLYIADTQEDPARVYEALSRAEQLAPEDLNIQRRLLLHGRLHERNPKNLDFSVIKSFLLNAFEHPEKHRPEDLRKMERELFDEPRLQRALELAQDRAAFLRSYLEDLSRDYMRVFISSDSSHVPKVLGFSFKGALPRYLAMPALDILKNVFSSPYLSREEAQVLGKAFYRAFFEQVQGETKVLDAQLGPELLALLR